MWLPLIYLMNSLLIIFFNIIICCTCNMCPRVVEQATQATTRENLSSGFPTKRILNQSLRLNRLARNWNFSRSKCRYDPPKKQTIKLLMRLRWCAGWSAPLFLQITEDRFLQSQSNCYPWTLRTCRKHGKYDNSDIIVICAVSSKHLQCARVVLLVTVFYITQPDIRK